MIKKVINSLEAFIEQVLSLNSAAILGGGQLGSVLLALNEDGSIKTNEKNEVEIVGAYPDSLLFRGQCNNYPLIPKLGRVKQDVYFERIESKLIGELKRRGDKLIRGGTLNDWDLLVYAQHFGLTTRLLDWTSNPLIALWFACQNEDDEKSAFVYVLKSTDDNMLSNEDEKSPFELQETKIYKPNLNNDRIIAQNGWFTIHSLRNEKRKFLPLNEESNFVDKIWVIEIPKHKKSEILGKLDILGINYETIYLGIEGTCRYLNWLNDMS